MKLCRFGSLGAERPGVVIDGIRKDCSEHFTDWDRAFFTDGGIEKLKALLASEADQLPEVSATERWELVSRDPAR